MWATPRHHNAPPLLVFRAEDNLSLAHLRPQQRTTRLGCLRSPDPRDTASTCCFASGGRLARSGSGPPLVPWSVRNYPEPSRPQRSTSDLPCRPH